MKKVQKIACACFFGGVAFMTVSFVLMPKYWWFGLFAGMAAGFVTGYLGFDFKGVLLAMPGAWQDAKSDIKMQWANIYEVSGKWIKQPHPFVYSAIVLSILGLWLFDFMSRVCI